MTAQPPATATDEEKSALRFFQIAQQKAQEEYRKLLDLIRRREGSITNGHPPPVQR